MSLYYTSSRRPFPWSSFIFNFSIPLLLILNLADYWVRGELAPWWAVFATCVYMFYRIGRRIAGQVDPWQVYLFACGFASAALTVYTVVYSYSDLLIVVLEVMTVLLFIGGILRGHEVRLGRLGAPVESTRASEFPGVYCITCRPNGKQYIGQTSRPIRERWQQHRYDLQARRHANRWLQADWDMYRPEQFTFSVLEVVTDPVWLFERERCWQDKDYDAAQRYNPPNIPSRSKTTAVQRRKPVKRTK